MTATDRTPAEQATVDHLRLLLAGHLDEWIELFAADAAFSFPFAPPGMTPELHGRDELLAHMRGFPETFTAEVVGLRFVPTASPTTAVAPFDLRGVAKPTGKPYPQRCITVVTVDDRGRIRRFEDYWNPQVAATALEHDDAAPAGSAVGVMPR